MQIENEYSAIQRAYRALGDSYVQWAAKMAQSMNIGVPWAMCKQNDAPDPMVHDLWQILSSWSWSGDYKS